MGTYQAHALDEFGAAGNSGMVRVVRQVLTASTLPITAKLSDYIGRTFILVMTAVFWIIGPVIVATSTGLGSYLPGFLIYTLGHVCGNSKPASPVPAKPQFSTTPWRSTPRHCATVSSCSLSSTYLISDPS